MELTPQRILELLQAVPWGSTACLRLFWVRLSEGSRDAIAAQLAQRLPQEAVIALVLRTHSFHNANAVLADVMSLFELNQKVIEQVRDHSVERVTVLVLAKDDFRLVQASSPITLPDWFPVMPALETHFMIADLTQSAEIRPLNCPEARLDNVAELFFELEDAIVQKLREVNETDAARVGRFVSVINPGGGNVLDARPYLNAFEEHVRAIDVPRAYRPSSGDGQKYLAARLLRLTLNSSPKALAKAAADMGDCLSGSDSIDVRPTYFGVMWRPANAIPVAASNWHGIIVAMFQAYQLMNASAHADEFHAYAVALQYSTSINLRDSLKKAKHFVDSLG